MSESDIRSRLTRPSSMASRELPARASSSRPPLDVPRGVVQAEDPKSRRVLRAKCWIPALAAVSRRASTFSHSWWRAAIRSSGRRSTLRYDRPSGISRRMNRRFYACRARIAPGQHPWVGLPTMQFECSREWGEWWVSGGVVASASAATHRPPSTGGRGGGCSFKPKKYHANTCPASPDV